MTIPAPTKVPDDVIERVMIQGDLSKLTVQERTVYYQKVCQSLGLNPLTRPFEYIVLNGKLQLYARRDCADQLRKIHGISIKVVSHELTGGVYTVHVHAKDKNDREDEDLGVVPIPDTLKGEARANQVMKAITKAKRRVTLSICGLGFLDELEVEDVPGARQPPQPAPNVMKAIGPEPPHDDATGEILEPEPTSRPAALDEQAASTQLEEGQTAEVPASAIGAGTVNPAEEFIRLDREAAEVARTGSPNLEDLWKTYTGPQKRLMKQAFDRRHKPMAERADYEIENELAARDPLGDAPL